MRNVFKYLREEREAREAGLGARTGRERQLLLARLKALEPYDALLMTVLEELRQAAHPDMRLEKHHPSVADATRGYVPGQPTRYGWSIEWSSYDGSRDTWDYYPQVEVTPVFDRLGQLGGFSVNRRGGVSIECSVSEEELVRTLKALYPSRTTP